MLIFGIKYYPLMRICRTFIRCVGENDWGFLVGNIVDGERIFIVAIADFATLELLIGSMVDEALRIVYIAVL
jgi:hypothetical protein